MPKYLIQRDLPNVGRMSADEMRDASRQSCSVLQNIGPEIQWVHSYVTGDQIHCVYIAPDEDLIREHARKSGFPASRILRIEAIIDPATAEDPVTAG